MEKISAADIAKHLANLINARFGGAASGGYKISRKALLAFADHTSFRESFKAELMGNLKTEHEIWTIEIDDCIHLIPRTTIQEMREVTTSALNQQGKKGLLSPAAAWPFPTGDKP